MWPQEDGYDRHNKHRIVNGPELARLVLSHNAYMIDEYLPLEFTTDEHIPPFGTPRELKLCVARMEKVGPERVTIKLVDRPHGGDFNYRIVHGYNFKKHRGNMEEFRKSKDGPLGYEPVRLPNVDERMRLTDKEFIMLHALQMLSYTREEGYIFPLRCSNHTCSNPIRHHLDMRKIGGQVYCPECFKTTVLADTQSGSYLRRCALLLPDKMLAIPIWYGGVMSGGE